MGLLLSLVIVLVGAPLAATINLIGFKATGIAAGSYAAKLMSMGAAAGNGGVASGGIVATCQHIGAIGLG